MLDISSPVLRVVVPLYYCTENLYFWLPWYLRAYFPESVRLRQKMASQTSSDTASVDPTKKESFSGLKGELSLSNVQRSTEEDSAQTDTYTLRKLRKCNVCPATMGDTHQFLDGECSWCGLPEPVLAKAEQSKARGSEGKDIEDKPAPPTPKTPSPQPSIARPSSASENMEAQRRTSSDKDPAANKHSTTPTPPVAARTTKRPRPMSARRPLRRANYDNRRHTAGRGRRTMRPSTAGPRRRRPKPPLSKYALIAVL